MIRCNQPLLKFAQLKGFEGDTKSQVAVYLSVCEDSAICFKYKSPAEVEFRGKSNE